MSTDSIRVSVSARLVIRTPDGRFLIITDMFSERAGNPTGWFIGGGARGTTKQIRKLTEDYGAHGFEGKKGTEDHPNDLRFKVPFKNLAGIEKWVKKNQGKLGFPGVARKELFEETKECGLPLKLARRFVIANRLFGAYTERRIDFSYLTFPVQPVMTECYDHMVLAEVPPSVMPELEAAVAREKLLHLVSRAEIAEGASKDGLPIPRFCVNWLPKE